jgi:hypothetical protein
MYQLGFDRQATPSTFYVNRSGTGTAWVAQTTFCSRHSLLAWPTQRRKPQTALLPVEIGAIHRRRRLLCRAVSSHNGREKESGEFLQSLAAVPDLARDQSVQRV